MRRYFTIALLALAATTATAADRDDLSHAQLTSRTFVPDAPAPNKAFLSRASLSPRHVFTGTLVIPEHAMRTDPEELRPAVLAGKKTQLFPGVSLHFVANHGFLVPVQRDILILPDSDSFWQLQVAPGRVWREPGDEGMSRASFPFFLTSIIENETYNGIASFLFNDDSVSMLRYQIVQQLAPFMLETRFVAFGQVPIEYRPARLNDAELLAEFAQEIGDRAAWRPWSELQERYGEELFKDFDSGIDPALVATSGLIIDDVVYVRSMATPYGDYPFPREMRHGVWSVTKSAAGLVTLLRMAQKYGDEILDYKIKDYLDVTATHDGWDDVTIGHAMSMATGIGTGTLDTDPNIIGSGDASNNFDAKDFADYMAWYLAPSLKGKLDEVFKIPSYPWGPGEYARYRDRDIFVMAAALESLYRSREGDDADLWQMMVDEVYRPIGIHHMPQSRTTEESRPGTPLLAWGLYMTIDDIAKIGALMQNGGKHNGKQLLSAGVLAEALYETDVRGLPTGETSRFGEHSYHLSLWHQPYVSASGRKYSIPQMTGYGGNIVQLMPNGIIGFRIGVGGGESIERMAIVADAIRPFDDHSRRSAD